MPTVKWTDAQWDAITARGNILVSAAAGSGKTATLTARIINLLRDETVSLRDMLIVTFTKAAAGELKARIGREIAAAAVSDSSMARHLTAIPSAEICTIHAYCHSLLRRYFGRLSLTPDFSIADDAEAELMKERAMEDVIDDFFRGELTLGSGGESGGYADMIAVADALGKTKDASGLDAALRELYDKLRSLGLGPDWLLSVADGLDADAEKDFFMSPFGQVVREEVKLAASHHRRVIQTLRDRIAADEVVAKSYLEAADADTEYITRLERITGQGTYREIKAALESYEAVSLSKLSTANKTADSILFQNARKTMKKEIALLSARHFSVEEDKISDSMRGTARMLRSAAEICRVFDERFTALKRERNILDYPDLELYALKLLEGPDGKPTDAAEEESRRLKFVFIDEYQDTNSVQDRIFRAVSICAERFFVGDIKQSIYRFRGAEPEVFSGYRRVWSPLGTESPADTVTADGAPSSSPYPPGHSIFMSENFRCAQPIIDFVNSVSRYMFPESGIPFSEEDCLRFGGGEDESAPVEVCIIDKPGRGQAKGGESTPAGEEDGAATAPDDPEAEYVASRVAELVRSGERPGNIAILLRGIEYTGAAYEEALSRRGIPVKNTGSRPFMEESEVLLVFDLLRTVDNPMRDVDLAGAMCSSVFGFTLDELVRVRLSDSTSPLWYTVQTYAGEGEDEALREKCASLAGKISALRETERGMSADRFIEHLFSELDLFSAPEVTEKPCGEANLHTIRDAASTYESGVFGGLYGFLRFAEEKLSENESVTDGGDGNAVTIMTMHKAKGLEFPVCFLPCLGKGRNEKDENANLLLHRSLGAAMRLPDPGGLVRCGTPVRTAISEVLRREGVEEEMRVLYVAMTRARRRLIVTASLEKAEEKLEEVRRSMAFVDRYTKSRTARFIDHILGAVMTDGGGGCRLTVIPAAETANGDAVASVEAREREAEENPIPTDKIQENFAFAYPYGYLSGIPSKLAVSRLYPAVLDDDDGAAELGSSTDSRTDGEEEMPRPRFMTGGTDTSPAERGTSTHVVLQFADFEALRHGGVRAEIDRLVSLGFITERMAGLVSVPQVERFAESGLMDRMLGARRLVREHRFNVSLPAADFTEDEALREKLRESGEKITVQGVFDCVMEDEDGRLILVDYKTDALTAYELTHPAAAAEKLIRRHKLQLSYYGEACRLLFGRKPDETYIYSLPLGDVVAV